MQKSSSDAKSELPLLATKNLIDLLSEGDLFFTFGFIFADVMMIVVVLVLVLHVAALGLVTADLVMMATRGKTQHKGAYV